MHLHSHIRECLLDFGSLHTFWCYAFERYNGILGAFHTNQKSIEAQLMRKFCQEQEMLSLNLDIPEELSQLLPSRLPSFTISGDIVSLLHLSHASLDQFPPKWRIGYCKDTASFT